MTMDFQSFKRTLSQLQSDLTGLSRLVRAVPQFIKDRVTPQGAEEEIRKDLEFREERFLLLARVQIFQRSDSPYRRLFRLAGCEFSDLRHSVRRGGIEQTLLKLAREGVYLTSAEFKGKKDVIRGHESFRISPGSFDSNRPSPGYRSQSSGTTNDPIRSFVSLDLLAIRTPATCVTFAAHGLFSRSHAMYEAILPAAAGLNNLLIYAKMGVPTERWFARRIPTVGKLEPVYHSLVTRAVVRAANRCGSQLPEPRFFVEGDEIERIVRWIAENQRRKRTCCVTTAASNAVRVAHAASRLGISLDGVKFIVTGEPCTDAKREAIARTGAVAIPRYAYGGSINIGYGCANPLYTDELHVNQHLLALLPRLTLTKLATRRCIFSSARPCIHPFRGS